MPLRRLMIVLSFALPMSAGAQALQGPAGAREVVTAQSAMMRLLAPVDAARDGPPPLASLDGAYAMRVWNGGDAGPLAAIKALQARFAQAGFDTALLCVAAECGGYDFYAALDLAPPPEMALGLHDFVHLTMRKDDAALLSATASALGGTLRVQAALVETAAAERAEQPPVEQSPADSPRPATSLAPLAARLRADGRAVLEGVEFLLGSVDVAPGSAPALDAAADALAALPEMKVVVVGHTDSEGAIELNLSVSKARAQAVAAALAARGVAAERLSAEGAAWLAPRASNATPQGRALNRRVELVAR